MAMLKLNEDLQEKLQLYEQALRMAQQSSPPGTPIYIYIYIYIYSIYIHICVYMCVCVYVCVCVCICRR